jgi:hypothetical protein
MRSLDNPMVYTDMKQDRQPVMDMVRSRYARITGYDGPVTISRSILSTESENHFVVRGFWLVTAYIDSGGSHRCFFPVADTSVN